jgi:hypothetical protein
MSAMSEIEFQLWIVRDEVRSEEAAERRAEEG